VFKARKDDIGCGSRQQIKVACRCGDMSSLITPRDKAFSWRGRYRSGNPELNSSASNEEDSDEDSDEQDSDGYD